MIRVVYHVDDNGKNSANQVSSTWNGKEETGRNTVQKYNCTGVCEWGQDGVKGRMEGWKETK